MWHHELYKVALVTFPSASQGEVDSAINRTVSKFFRQTRLLKDDYYFDTQCKVTDYLLHIPEKRGIVRVECVRSTAQTPAKVASLFWTPMHPASHRFGHEYWVELDTEIPIINIQGSIRPRTVCVHYSWTPTVLECELPQHLIIKYFETLLDGVLAILYRTPTAEVDEKFSIHMSELHERRFLEGISDGAVDEGMNHTNRVLYMQGGTFI